MYNPSPFDKTESNTSPRVVHKPEKDFLRLAKTFGSRKACFALSVASGLNRPVTNFANWSDPFLKMPAKMSITTAPILAIPFLIVGFINPCAVAAEVLASIKGSISQSIILSILPFLASSKSFPEYICPRNSNIFLISSPTCLAAAPIRSKYFKYASNRSAIGAPLVPSFLG